ncbi:MAG: hypothetical protein A2268_09005 [Candidatus Raymondbacteria bacterium RifOxyA12_full_50_37]|uniref:Short-chain dehydrogenase n=1 Tax=Candidatus Raymondbacteria bacterium RIFOXYD12_FULL_49_13 TaxID=1817890 RepID=A0A1F7FGQ3_UNCRA|nr:MAG: hypothetical protein A2268_09005 [Candidatus Raymondbacteria bacterium RifOxyA12_full_50_37]OGJ92937.1 MAG: hypothetical protein A2248_08705 [Candidatus Raymondbacteria bacterium RIFOXYA2_FULL_49_16]OGK01370.1 MAG: hypothetical protein A2350_19415 [Candidatus Raymondbacteria bacterium RifOxyB12_full_50_8]OGK03814.1 MAG: hypothetical protein A2487_04200 [Candidatus Raymondbacteria bacterium RifOxyC12_full_50_8]OGK05677.1 MAG: hypothetical protein A2519_03765 [Candidatus Raymondbacteria b
MKPRAILITGSAKRLGRELALESARMGFAVIAHFRTSRSAVLSLGTEVRKLGVPFFPIQADLSKNPDKLIRACVKLPVRLIGLVNNASVFEKGDLLQRNEARGTRREAGFWQMFQVNAFAPLILSTSFFKQSPASRLAPRSFIINLLDANIDGFNRNFQLYRISKRLLREFTVECAALFAPKVRVNAIAPGAILPSRFNKRPGQTWGTIAGLLKAFRYLVESEATGQIMYCDQGLRLFKQGTPWTL